MDKQEYEDSVQILRRWARAYYHLDNPVATDDEYDVLYHKVMKHEMANEIENLDSPTHFVGWKDD